MHFELIVATCNVFRMNLCVYTIDGIPYPQINLFSANAERFPRLEE